MHHPGGAGIGGRVGFGSLSAPTDAHPVGGVEGGVWSWLKHPTHSICDKPAPVPWQAPALGFFFLGIVFPCPVSPPMLCHPHGTSWPAASQTSTLLQPFPGPGIMKDSKIIFVLAELHREWNRCPWPGKKLNFAAGSIFLFVFFLHTDRLCSQSKANGNIFEGLSCISCMGFAAELQPHWLYCSMKNADSTPCINPKWKRAPGLGLSQITSMHAEFAA